MIFYSPHPISVVLVRLSCTNTDNEKYDKNGLGDENMEEIIPATKKAINEDYEIYLKILIFRTVVI